MSGLGPGSVPWTAAGLSPRLQFEETLELQEGGESSRKPQLPRKETVKASFCLRDPGLWCSRDGVQRCLVQPRG